MKQSSPSNKSILIGLPSGSGQVPLSMVESLLKLHKPYPCGFISMERQRIDKVRSYFVVQAVKNNFDYLFMVDDDNPIPEDTLEKFIEDDKDIVVAPILSRNPNMKTGKYDLCAMYGEEIDVKGAKLRMYTPITQFKEDGYLHKVDIGGTGAMLIKRHVLEAMVTKYPEGTFEFGDITVNGQRRTMSEDAEFCERAADLGFEIWLDERIKPIHLSGQRFVQYGV